MKWKLRYPLVFATFASMAVLYNQVPGIVIAEENYILRSLQFLASVCLILYVLEVTRVSSKEVRASIGLLIIAASVIIQLL